MTMEQQQSKGVITWHKKTIQIADKPTLDLLKAIVSDTDKEPISVSELPYDFCIGSAVVLNSEIHILGGNISGTTTNHYKWNGVEWTEVSTLPYNFNYGYAVVLKNEIHILSGNGSLATNHYKWDGVEWTEVSTLPYDLRGGCTVVLDNEIHILGSSSYRRYHYKWDGTEWSSVSTLPFDFSYGCAVVLNNEIHILGSSNSVYGRYHYKWDGTQWSNTTALPYDFAYGCAVVLNNEIHILGGNSTYVGYCYTRLIDYNYETSILPYNFIRGCAVVLNNEIHILSGNNTSTYRKHYIVRHNNDVISFDKFAKNALNSIMMDTAYGNKALMNLLQNTTYGLSALKTAIGAGAEQDGNEIIAKSVTYVKGTSLNTVLNISGKGKLLGCGVMSSLMYGSSKPSSGVLTLRVTVDGTVIFYKGLYAKQTSTGTYKGSLAVFTKDFYPCTVFGSSYQKVNPLMPNIYGLFNYEDVICSSYTDGEAVGATTNYHSVSRTFDNPIKFNSSLKIECVNTMYEYTIDAIYTLD